MCKDISYAIAKAYNGSKTLNQITQVEKSCRGIATVYCVFTFSIKMELFRTWLKERYISCISKINDRDHPTTVRPYNRK